MSNNNQKIPCGGFYLGDGLTMDGNTLKSLGGAYIKVKSDDGGRTFEFMDDSPLKTFDEIVQKMETSVVTMLVFFPAEGKVASYFFNNYHSGEIDSINFCTLSVTINNMLMVGKVSIDSDNKITFSASAYTLTPAT